MTTETTAKHTPTRKKTLTSIAITLAVLLFITSLPFVALSILSTNSGTRWVSNLTSDMIDGQVTIGDLSYTYISSFPYLNLQVEELSIVSNALEKSIFPNDTIAYIQHFSIGVNPLKYLFRNTIDLNELTLNNSNINAVVDSTGKANWEIYSSSDSTESSSTPLPKIILKNIIINDVSASYANFKDSISASLGNFAVTGDGYISNDTIISKIKGEALKIRYVNLASTDHASIDTLNITGVGTLIKEFSKLKLSLSTNAIQYCGESITTREMPLSIPIEIDTYHNFDSIQIITAAIKSYQVIAGTNGSIKFIDEGYDLNLNWNINVPDASELFNLIPYNFANMFDDVTSSGTISSEGTVIGKLTSNEIPSVKAKIAIDKLKLAYANTPYKLDNLTLHGDLFYDGLRPASSWITLKNLNFKAGKSFVKAHGDIKYLLSNPHINASLRCFLDLNYLTKLVPETMISNITMEGKLKADLKANFTQNDLLKGKWTKIYALGNVQIDHILLNFPKYDFKFLADNFLANLGCNSIQSRRSKRTMLFSGKLEFSKLLAVYGKMINANVSRMSMSTYADNIYVGVPDGRLSLTCDNMEAALFDTLHVSTKKMRISTTLHADSTDRLIPRLRATLRIDSLFYSEPSYGVFSDSTRMHAFALPRVRRFKYVNGERELIDPSTRKEMTLDSIIRLGQVIINDTNPSNAFIRRFTVEGKIYNKILKYSSPYFNLPTSVRRVDVSFINDTLHLNNFRMRVGRSSITLKGEVDNPRRAFLRGTKLGANFNLTSRRIDANQIFRAIYAGEQLRKQEGDAKREAARARFKERRSERIKSGNFNPAKRDSIISRRQRAKENFTALSETNSSGTATDTTTNFGLIIVPSRLNFNFIAKIDTLLFGDVVMRSFTGDALIKNNTLKIDNLSTNTDLGDIRMNLMYHCRSLKSAKAGVDLWTDDISVEKLIKNIPAVDSIIPMLRSFKGNVDCQLSAMAELDSTMSVVMPSINAAAALSGKNMVLLDGETFAEIAKMLMFKRKTENVINSISVELIAKNNQLQILPFMLEMDKYKAAIGGTHGFDMNFKYHISVLESPLPFKIGIDVFGNLDDFKFKLVPVKYKDENTITRSDNLSNEKINVRIELQHQLQKLIQEAIDTP